MANSSAGAAALAAVLMLLGLLQVPNYSCAATTPNFTVSDFENIQVALNLEYFEAEYFLWAAYGYGLDKLAPYLVGGGPPPIGPKKANLTPYYNDVVLQLGLQEIGHLRYYSVHDSYTLMSCLTFLCASCHF
jgi:hypothetical protein